MKNKQRNLFIIYTIMLLLIGFVVFFVLSKKAFLYTVSTASMFPKIPENSLIIVIPDFSYNVGDVVTYKFKNKQGTLVTHRIIEVKDFEDTSIYFTKGDNNEFLDATPVTKREIIGKVIFSFPGFGRLFNFDFIVFLVYVPLGFFFGITLRELYIYALE